MVCYILFFFVVFFHRELFYAAAGPHALGSLWALVRGRMFARLTSASASLALSYIVFTLNAEERLSAMSPYRTFASIALVLRPLLSKPLKLVKFDIGTFKINANNTPSLMMSGIAFTIVCVCIYALQNVKMKPVNVFGLLLTHRTEFQVITLIQRRKS